jgi:hypothetical protein
VPGRLAEIAIVATLAMIVTVAMAAPVLRAPSERVFGAEIAGRHHDPFTVMRQFERPIGVGLRGQPITDVTGALIARAAGGVAAYNWVVLLSFPLAAVAAYLLARHLALSPFAAAGSAMAFAFAPFHLAHAAYHPHIAQVQWVALYFLALWRCLDAATPRAIAVLVAATLAVTLSNFYGGFIAAVITPVAIATYWLVTRQAGTRPWRQLAVTAGTLLVMAVAGSAYWWWTLSRMVAEGAEVMASRNDLFRYSAKWWSYLVPPISQPLLGDRVARFWATAGISDGLLEQQVSLGWGIVVLGLVAIAAWPLRARPAESLARVPVLVLVAAAALVCSLSPERSIGTVTVMRPSALLYEIMPMFRSYARFGVVVQLMAALLAGIGAEVLWRSGRLRNRIVCGALLALVAAEYAASPAALWRDVLPTAAHRWVMQQPAPLRVLDCAPSRAEVASVPWLTGGRVAEPGAGLDDCAEPGFASKLAALGYTHLLLRDGGANAAGGTPMICGDGLRRAASFPDSRVYAVTAVRPALYTNIVSGFSPREHANGRSWRWMGAEAAWIIVNTTGVPTAVTLDVELSAFAHDRQLVVALEEAPIQTILAEPTRRTHRIGPFTVPRGAHQLRFRPVLPATVADRLVHNGDRRPLSLAVGNWTWKVAGEQP